MASATVGFVDETLEPLGDMMRIHCGATDNASSIKNHEVIRLTFSSTSCRAGLDQILLLVTRQLSNPSLLISADDSAILRRLSH
jgi:hypothetical protein